MIATGNITGLVLAGGRASRMGGIDKGLQAFRGVPLARHVLERLRPQVGALALNANRNTTTYASWNVPVWSDTQPDCPGPLAGFLAGLTHCTTDWLLTVPCDTPLFPPDLARRLARAADDKDAAIAIASTIDAAGQPCPQPVFCLMHKRLASSLRDCLAQGERKARVWAEQQGCAVARFDQPGDDPLAFGNANTLAELLTLEGDTP